MNAESQDKQWGQIVTKAWADEGFKRRLLANPAAVLKEYGLPVPPGAQIRIHENTACPRRSRRSCATARRSRRCSAGRGVTLRCTAR
jgi:hypothetical protein